MLIIYLFWFQMLLWLIYWFTVKEYPFAKKLQQIKKDGYLEEHIQRVIDDYGLHDLKFQDSPDYIFMFNPEKKTVTYTQESHLEYSLDELFSTIHELTHAKQLEERNRLYLIRCFWSKHIRKWFLPTFILSMIIALVNALTWDFTYMFLFPASLLFLHYLYAIIVLLNERNANKRTYRYLEEHYVLTDYEKSILKKNTAENHLDYILNIPVLLIFG